MSSLYKSDFETDNESLKQELVEDEKHPYFGYWMEVVDDIGDGHYYFSCARYNDEGMFHTEDNRPAIIFFQKTPQLDEPRVITQVWHQHGQKHRLDGPAHIEEEFGSIEYQWWLSGEEYSFDKWLNNSSLPDEDKFILKLKYMGEENNGVED